MIPTSFNRYSVLPGRYSAQFILLILLLFGLTLEAPAQNRGRRGGNRPQAAAPPGAVPDLTDPVASLPLELPDLGEGPSIAPVVPAKVVQYASRIFEKYDTNGDGLLQREEWEKMPGSPQSIDTDGDFVITLEEFVRFIALYGAVRTLHRPNPPTAAPRQTLDPAAFSHFRPLSVPLGTPQEAKKSDTATPPSPALPLPDEQADVPRIGEQSDEKSEDGEPAKELSDEELDSLSYEKILSGQFKPSEKKYYRPLSELRGVPNWFILRDKNGDGQLSMVEFDPTLSPQGLSAFGKLDKNGDGFLTPDEVQAQGK